MPKWEYKEVPVESFIPRGPGQPEAKLIKNADVMTEEYGKKGWELVSVVVVCQANVSWQCAATAEKWFFKRQIE